MEEDDMVMRVGNSLVGGERERRTDKEGRAASLAEVWPWQPPKDPLH